MASKTNVLPKMIVFDLDNTVWYPEMYQLYGGAPFTETPQRTLKDRKGTEVALCGDVSNIMYELKTDPKWSSTTICVASFLTGCIVDWAAECINKFSIGTEGNYKLKDVLTHIEIYGCGKDTHFRNLHEKFGGNIKYEEMLFFDDQMYNHNKVCHLGVTCVFTPDGVTRELFDLGVKTFPAPGKILTI